MQSFPGDKELRGHLVNKGTVLQSNGHCGKGMEVMARVFKTYFLIGIFACASIVLVL